MTGSRGAHWSEYLIEGAGLALFMVSACAFGTLLFLPASPVVEAIPGALARRGLMGLAMGLTAVALIYSSWGRRSGAHFNPATTVTFWRLGKVATRDALGYVVAQSAGGLLGVLFSAWVLGPALAEPPIRFVATIPGSAGVAAAFAGELAIAFVLMGTVLWSSNDARWAPFTGLLAGGLVATSIAFESPISGMSLNPARTVASAVPAGVWTAVWIYLVAPPLGMLAAAQLYVARCGLAGVFCAKLRHDDGGRCVFRCRHAELGEASVRTASPVARRRAASTSLRRDP